MDSFYAILEEVGKVAGPGATATVTLGLLYRKEIRQVVGWLGACVPKAKPRGIKAFFETEAELIDTAKALLGGTDWHSNRHTDLSISAALNFHFWARSHGLDHLSSSGRETRKWFSEWLVAGGPAVVMRDYETLAGAVQVLKRLGYALGQAPLLSDFQQACPVPS
jgi:hypothetical protein